ncbi:MAG: hypothetical protein JWP91_177 [Fibrobacteres bacterium]|nr:hypothetical protein [Fibrobacterota bacterium]
MWKSRVIPFFILLAGMAAAQDKPAGGESASQAKEKSAPPSANRKAYDALYSDILKTLPQEGRSKVDSARGLPVSAAAKPANPASAENAKKDALEKRKKEMEALPPEVKARVDKVLSDLDNRRKEKQSEFKELRE